MERKTADRCAGTPQAKRGAPAVSSVIESRSVNRYSGPRNLIRRNGRKFRGPAARGLAV